MKLRFAQLQRQAGQVGFHCYELRAIVNQAADVLEASAQADIVHEIARHLLQGMQKPESTVRGRPCWGMSYEGSNSCFSFSKVANRATAARFSVSTAIAARRDNAALVLRRGMPPTYARLPFTSVF